MADKNSPAFLMHSDEIGGAPLTGSDTVGAIVGSSEQNRATAAGVVADATDRYEGSRPVQYAMSANPSVQSPQTPAGPPSNPSKTV